MEAEFPLFLLRVDGKRKFMPLREAGAIYNSNYSRVELLGEVLESDLSVRDLTGDERQKIVDIADGISASK